MFQVSQERVSANKCPDAKAKDGKVLLQGATAIGAVHGQKGRKIDQADQNSTFGSFNRSDTDPFLRYWIKLYDLAGQFPMRYPWALGPCVRRHKRQL